MTKKVRVEIIGCDDMTIFDLEVNEIELGFLEQISNISQETSQYQCQPIIIFKEVNE